MDIIKQLVDDDFETDLIGKVSNAAQIYKKTLDNKIEITVTLLEDFSCILNVSRNNELIDNTVCVIGECQSFYTRQYVDKLIELLEKKEEIIKTLFFAGFSNEGLTFYNRYKYYGSSSDLFVSIRLSDYAEVKFSYRFHGKEYNTFVKFSFYEFQERFIDRYSEIIERVGGEKNA